MTKANGAYHKRDLYSEVTTRILAELENGAAPWVKPWSATPGQNHPHNAATSRPYSGCNVVLLWMTAQRHGYATPRYLTFKQCQELGGNVRKGEHGTRVYFVKQLQVRDRSEPQGSDDAIRMVPMLREYTVFNVSQCEGLPQRITTPEAKAPRNKDQRDGLADEFLALLVLISVRGMVRLTTYRVRISSHCQASLRSRMPIDSMAQPSMSLAIGREQRRGLIVAKE